MKKKLGIIAALAMCVTVGGVYAQWSYSEGIASGMNGSKTVELAGVSTNTKKGVITVDTNGFSIEIDDTNNDKYGELVLTGNITVTFSPNSDASDDVQTNGIPMKATLSMSEDFANFTYDFDSNSETAEETVFNLSTNSLIKDTASKSWTITSTQIAELFKLTTKTVTINEQQQTVSVVYLPTYQDYIDFQNALARCNLIISVSEYVAPANP